MDFSVDFLTKTVSTGEDELKLQIWDTAGYFLFYFILFYFSQEKFRSVVDCMFYPKKGKVFYRAIIA